MVYNVNPFVRMASPRTSRLLQARLKRDETVTQAIQKRAPGLIAAQIGPRRTRYRVTGGGNRETAAERRARIMGPKRRATLSAITVDPTQSQPWYADPLKNVIESVSAAVSANRIAKENARRLAAGLPPLSQSEMQSLAPSANVAVALPPEAKMLLYVGAGAIALLTLSALTKGRR